MKRHKFDHCGRHYEKYPNGEITISTKAYNQNLEKVCLARERLKQLDDELSATESHEFEASMDVCNGEQRSCSIHLSSLWKCSNEGKDRPRCETCSKQMRSLMRSSNMKTSFLTYRVLDLTSCGLIGVSDASLEGVDRFGHPTDQDSKTVKVYSQAGIGIFIREKISLVSLGHEYVILHDLKSVSLEHGRRNSRFGFAMQFCGDLLN